MGWIKTKNHLMLLSLYRNRVSPDLMVLDFRISVLRPPFDPTRTISNFLRKIVKTFAIQLTISQGSVNDLSL